MMCLTNVSKFTVIYGFVNVDTFYATGLFLCPPDISGVYRNRPVARNELKKSFVSSFAGQF